MAADSGGFGDEYGKEELRQGSLVNILRDPTHFPFILNYLRTGHVVNFPKSPEERDEISQEAEYYGLFGLVELMQGTEKGEGGKERSEGRRREERGEGRKEKQYRENLFVKNFLTAN
jgi:hypothetical protein